MTPLRSGPLATLVLVFTALSLAGMPAMAAKPGKVFKGKIILSESTFPYRFKSDSHFIRHMKKVDKKKWVPDEDGDVTINYMVFAKKPVGRLEAKINFYDVSVPKQKRLVETLSFYPESESDSILSGEAELDGETFLPDKRYRMEFSRGYGEAPLASTEFVIVSQ